MGSVVASGRLFRFGTFEAEPVQNALTRSGVRVKIQEQPFRLLLLLLDRPGEIVSREELRQKLWPEGTFVDFDGSLNVILKRLRAALDDDPDNPRFIETVPRRGYRFIAPVSVTERTSDGTSLSPVVTPSLQGNAKPISAEAKAPVTESSSQASRKRKRSISIFAGCAAAVVVLTSALLWHNRSASTIGHVTAASNPVRMRTSVAVLGFQNLSGRSDNAWLATAVSEMLSTELAAGDQLRLVSGEDVANLRVSSPWSQSGTLDRNTTGRIRNALNSDVLVLGSYMMLGTSEHGQLRLDVRMQDAKTGEIVTEIAEVGTPQDLFRLISQVGAKLRDRLGVQPLEGNDEAGVLAALPLEPEAARLYSLGVIKLRQFDALAAKDLLQQAADADPKYSLAHAMLARAWSQLGYEQKRREEAKKAFDLSADLPRAQRMLVEGEYYESTGDQDHAASVYHALYELFPDNIEYGLRLVNVQTLLGHGTQAMDVISRLRKLPSPASDDPSLDLAEARAMKDDKPVALVLIQSAMRKASERGQRLIYALARKDECLNLLYGEQPEQGIPACEDAHNIFLAAGNRAGAADCIRLMADGIGSQGHFEQAIATYERALDALVGLGEHEKTGAVLNNMAIGFANQGNLNRAEQLYREAKVQFEQAGDVNNQVTAVGNIADILYMRGNLPGAEKLYNEALRISGSVDNIENGYLLYRLADLCLTQGRVQDGHRLAQQAIDSYLPTHGSYQYLTAAMIVLGEALEAEGDLEGASAQFEKTLAIRQKIGAVELVAESQVELAGLAIEQGHPEKAEASLRAVLPGFEKEKVDPDSSSAYSLLSRALLMEGKVEEARTASQRASELSLTSSDPALRLPAEIQQARVEMASLGEGGSGNAIPMRRLEAAISSARKLGYYNLEHEGRLALGELQLKVNASVGHKQLQALASETRSRGFELLARHAEVAMASDLVVAQGRSH